MAKFELKKSLEVTKLNKRTGIPVSGPPVTIPFGALVEDVELDYDHGKFTYLGEPYRCASDVLKSALDRGPQAAPAAAPAPAPAPLKASAPEPGPKPEQCGLQWEQLRSDWHPASRAKVPGGWLVAVNGSSLTFYPDPEHAWNGGSIA